MSTLKASSLIFIFAIYASKDGVIEPGSDVKLGEKAMGGLNSGDHAVMSATVQLPHGMGVGTWVIGWHIDPEGTATQNQGLILVGQGGGAPGEKQEFTQNNLVVVGSPTLTVTAPGFAPNPGGGPDLGGGGGVISPNPGNGGGGSEPVDPPAVPEVRIDSIRLAGDDIEVVVPGVLGKSYTLEGSPDMVKWSSIATALGDGTALVLRDEQAVRQSAKFYRVGEQPVLAPIRRK